MTDRCPTATLGLSTILALCRWAKTHNSLLIVTFDEDDGRSENHIATIIYGARVRPGQYVERISHYNVLSTLLAMYALPPFAEAATTSPIRTIWDHTDVTLLAATPEEQPSGGTDSLVKRMPDAACVRNTQDSGSLMM